jgi:IclR family KDG regulon transcriptional repressor
MMSIDNSNRSINRAVSILRSFSPEEFELSSADISRKVGLHRATTYRLLRTLTECGLLNRKEKTSKYTIGPLLYQLGTLYLDTIDVFKAATPVMETLKELTSEDVLMGMLDGGNMVIVMKEESTFHFKIGRHIGESIPAYASSMGIALLSELTEAEIDSLYPKEKLQPVTKKTITSKTELKRVLERVRKTGVASDRESGRIGVEGISSVVRDAKGNTVAALCVSMPIFRANQAKRTRIAKLVKMGTDLINSKLGYQNANTAISEIQDIRSRWYGKAQ